MAFDYSKLRGRIIEKYGSVTKFSEYLDLTRTSINMKLNDKVNFTRADIMEWAELLDIPKEEYGLYFFTKKLNAE